MPRATTPAIDRFSRLYIVATPPNSTRPDLGPCWIWTSNRNKFGYGQFWAGHPVRAHRWAYIYYKGAIPDGLDLDHLCHVRNCVNPDHLEAVTTRENLMRSNTIQARNAKKRHCIRGHAFDAENTYIQWMGDSPCRRCRKCDALRYHLRKAARAGVAVQLELIA